MTHVTVRSDPFVIKRRELSAVVIAPDMTTTNYSFSVEVQLINKDSGAPAITTDWKVGIERKLSMCFLCVTETL